MSANSIVIQPALSETEKQILTESETGMMSQVTATNQANIVGAMSSPWAKTQTSTSCSLSDVMSEQLAQELHASEENQIYEQFGKDKMDFELNMGNPQDTSDDVLLAQMLQHEFDREHDQELKLKESKFNADSKVRVSYDNYRAVHPSLWDEEEPEEEVLERQEVKEQQRNFRGRGISGKGKDIVTKHDAGISQRRNASRAMEQFPPEVNVGDGLDMRLSNKVYNKLKLHSKAESKRAARLHEKKDHSTAEHSMDPKTRLMMYKLVNGGTLDNVNGVISTGKESVVFHANSGSELLLPTDDSGSRFEIPPEEVAIKAFKTTLTDFKNRGDYVKGDVRFFKDEFKKQNPRKIIRIWADKEALNLRRMTRLGVPCPKVLLVRKHVLLMTFIGENRKAALKLKDAKLSTVDTQIAYEQVIENMRKMYRECLLVHGDLSEYNMLWHRDQVYFIDVSQAVDRHHPHAHEFLLRDCRNVSQFFTKRGVEGVMSQYELFNHVTGLDLTGVGKQFLMQIEEYEKNENQLRLGTSKKNYNFDFFFEKSMKDKKKASQRVEDKDQEHTDTRTQPQDNTESADQALENPALRNTDHVAATETGNDKSEVTAEEDYSSSDNETDEESALIFEKYIAERRDKLAKENEIELQTKDDEDKNPGQETSTSQ